MTASSDERGQVVVFTVLALLVLLGMAAFVVDAGSWFREKRQLQASADAAALAGAQALPSSPSDATSLALSYAGQNGGGVSPSDVTISSTYSNDDTIRVTAKDTAAPAFFSKIFGINSANISRHAAALVGVPSQAWGVAPIAVNCAHPLINDCDGSNSPVFNQETTIPLGKAGAPGAFDLINLDGSRGGTSPGTLASWLQYGYRDYLGLGDYYSDPGAKFNSSQMQSALNAVIGHVLLFPVYDTLTGNGANAKYRVIAWIGFHIDDFSARGSSGSITGSFTTYIARGIIPQGGGGPPYMGVTAIQLIE
jgi:Flp pilus assembly protein TadG